MLQDERRRVWGIAALLVAVLVLGWLLKARHGPASSPDGQPAFIASGDASFTDLANAPSIAAASAAPHRGGTPVITPKQQRLRTRVLDSLATAPPAPGPEVATSTGQHAVGNLKDHTGELNPETMRILSQEFMPMVQECYEHAHERNPKLGGMLALNVELAGAEGFGTIIESVEPASDLNQLDDDELVDCVRQSAFSLQLPQPLKSGRAARQLTMPFGEPATAR